MVEGGGGNPLAPGGGVGTGWEGPRKSFAMAFLSNFGIGEGIEVARTAV
jgi:hypothetical protein